MVCLSFCGISGVTAGGVSFSWFMVCCPTMVSGIIVVCGMFVLCDIFLRVIVAPFSTLLTSTGIRSVDSIGGGYKYILVRITFLICVYTSCVTRWNGACVIGVSATAVICVWTTWVMTCVIGI